MKFDHLANIHSIDMVCAKDRNHIWFGLLNQVYILINGISCARIPALAGGPHLRWNGNAEVIL